MNLTGDALRTTEQVLDPTGVDRCTREVDLEWSDFGLFPGFCQYFENNILKILSKYNTKYNILFYLIYIAKLR